MRVAIIGTGAAALGVLDYLSTVPEKPSITVFDYNFDSGPVNPAAPWTNEAIRKLYGQLPRQLRYGFPPPKTNFGNLPSSRDVPGWGKIWDSRGYGGLTQFWGLSALPFATVEMQGWPFSKADLDPHYRAISARIGIAGISDQIDEIYDPRLVTCGACAIVPAASILKQHVNSHERAVGGWAFVAGHSRVAVETRAGMRNACSKCGECMIGCPQGAMSSVATHMDEWWRSGLIERRIVGRVIAVDLSARSIVIDREGEDTVGSFDKIFIAAGCLNSTEIVMRSVGIGTGPVMTDNSVYSFPILQLGHHGWGAAADKYFSLTNIIVAAKPEGDGRLAMIQIYPIFDHIWRFMLPAALWSSFALVGRFVRRHALLGRIFLHGDYSQRYAVHLEGKAPARLTLARAATEVTDIPGLWRAMRRAFSGRGFFIPPVRPILHRTGSHYSSTLPLGDGLVGLDGSIAPDVYVVDSSVFPEAPATSPTLTIMANARRMAAEAFRVQ